MLRTLFFIVMLQGFAFSSDVPARCKPRPTVGSCTTSRIPVWYYNSILQKCRPFTYGGCGGNSNRFWTEAECSAVCVQSEEYVVTTKDPLITEKRAEDPYICKLPMASGNCSDSISSYYYSPVKKSCKKFTYKGCGGNENRFPTKQQCQAMCGFSAQSRNLIALVNNTEVREICTYQPLRGVCSNYTEAWYYDTIILECSKFTYGGCGGNLNRFTTKANCLAVCRAARESNSFPPGAIENSTDTITSACKQERAVGNCTDRISSWYFDYGFGMCRRFSYSGCNGNENRFSTRKECAEFCSGAKTENALDKDVYLNWTNIYGGNNDTDSCSQPPIGGNCSLRLEWWYYDKNSSNCQQFTYSGCGGNSNKFSTERECKLSCAHDLSTPIKKEKKTETDYNFNNPEICTLVPAEGKCQNSFIAWYFDVSFMKCRKFTYTGCGGNPNRFFSEEGCNATCVAGYPTKTTANTTKVTLRPRFCRLKPNPGPCTIRTLSWFYHSASRSCRVFVYGGCGGNKNRFSDRTDCEAKCQRGSWTKEVDQHVPSNAISPRFCKLSPRSSKCFMNFEDVWYYDWKAGKCYTFPRGSLLNECKGNDNSFESEKQCLAVCSQPIPFNIINGFSSNP